jgi:hypothetical protein
VNQDTSLTKASGDILIGKLLSVKRAHGPTGVDDLMISSYWKIEERR